MKAKKLYIALAMAMLLSSIAFGQMVLYTAKSLKIPLPQVGEKVDIFPELFKNQISGLKTGDVVKFYATSYGGNIGDKMVFISDGCPKIIPITAAIRINGGEFIYAKEEIFLEIGDMIRINTQTIRNECTATVKLTITGGTPPYTVKLDGAVLTNYAALTLGSGKHVLDVYDVRGCYSSSTLTVEPFVPKIIEDKITTYVGEKTNYTYPDGNRINVGPGVSGYTYTQNGCERGFILTVTEIYPPAVSIASVQGTGSVSPLVGKTVSLKGTITGVFKGEGFFMQDANAAWSGIWVSTSSTIACTLGCGVEVYGTVSEVANVTTITAKSVTIVASPIAINPIIVTKSGSEAEQYESVVVKVKGARAKAKDAARGEWTIYTTTTNDVIVNDLIYAYTPIVGDYYNVTGVVNARLDMFKISPRVGSDIENLKLTSVTPVSGIEYKVYPNPFNDRILIENNDKLTRAVITNVADQRVIDVVSPSHEIRTSNLVSGVYIVTLLNDKDIVKTEKFIKE